MTLENKYNRGTHGDSSLMLSTVVLSNENQTCRGGGGCHATLHGDTKTMNEILEYVHNTEIPLLSYNYETELSAIVNLIYLAARDLY